MWGRVRAMRPAPRVACPQRGALRDEGSSLLRRCIMSPGAPLRLRGVPAVGLAHVPVAAHLHQRRPRLLRQGQPLAPGPWPVGGGQVSHLQMREGGRTGVRHSVQGGGAEAGQARLPAVARSSVAGSTGWPIWHRPICPGSAAGRMRSSRVLAAEPERRAREECALATCRCVGPHLRRILFQQRGAGAKAAGGQHHSAAQQALPTAVGSGVVHALNPAALVDESVDLGPVCVRMCKSVVVVGGWAGASCAHSEC